MSKTVTMLLTNPATNGAPVRGELATLLNLAIR